MKLMLSRDENDGGFEFKYLKKGLIMRLLLKKYQGKKGGWGDLTSLIIPYQKCFFLSTKNKNLDQMKVY